MYTFFRSYGKLFSGEIGDQEEVVDKKEEQKALKKKKKSQATRKPKESTYLKLEGSDHLKRKCNYWEKEMLKFFFMSFLSNILKKLCSLRASRYVTKRRKTKIWSLLFRRN